MLGQQAQHSLSWRAAGRGLPGASLVSHPLTSLGNYTNWLKICKRSCPQKKNSHLIYNETHLSFFSPVFLHFPFFSLGQGKLPGPKGTKVGSELSAPHQGGAERVKQKNRGQRQAATHLPEPIHETRYQEHWFSQKTRTKRRLHPKVHPGDHARRGGLWWQHPA